MLNTPTQLTLLQPSTSQAFERAAARVFAFVDTDLLALCRQQLRATQERSHFEAPEKSTSLDISIMRLAEQFAVNVDSISEADIAKLRETMSSAQVNALINAIYLMDMALRLEQVAPVVLAGADATVSTSTGHTATTACTDDTDVIIAEAIAAFAATAVLADKVDVITGELVRLRCAQIHHCRLCGSLRQRKALDQGLDEALAERVARYEDGGLDEHVVAALKLVDTLIMFPCDADASLKAELDKHFSPEQIAELCFDVVKWSQQKALVALHIDAPPWEGIHVLDFDKDGQPVFEGPIQQSA